MDVKQEKAHWDLCEQECIKKKKKPKTLNVNVL